MASSETIAGVIARLGLTDPTEQELLMIEACCDDSESTIRKYRQQEETEEIEPKYKTLAIKMALYQYSKQGVDGVLSFSENSVSRSYEAADYPKSLISQITPRPKKIFTSEV